MIEPGLIACFKRTVLECSFNCIGKMNVEDEEDIVYAQLDLPSEGQRPQTSRANIQKPAEDDTVYADIAVFQPKPQQEDKVKVQQVRKSRRAKPFTLESDSITENRKKGLSSPVKAAIGISVIFILVGIGVAAVMNIDFSADEHPKASTLERAGVTIVPTAPKSEITTSR